MENVYMQSPDGEVREVPATPEALTPLMVLGWVQVDAPATAPAVTETKPAERKKEK